MDWNHLHAFLETAQRGSLSGAARTLGLTQPTLSRQIAALEQQLGVTLFERVGRTLRPTDAGLSLLDHARTMGAAADDLALAATGQSQAVEGLVSVSASDAVATWVLPPLIARIGAVAPGIVVEVVASNRLSDLRRREADIAIRHVRPEQPDLIGRLVRDATAGFYAAHRWVAEHGHPHSAQQALSHRFVGADRSGQFLAYLHSHGLPLSPRHCTVLTDNSVVAWQMVRQGLGIGVMMDDIAGAFPEVVRVLDDLPVVRFPIWLVTHRELHTARRFRVVFDLLGQALAEQPLACAAAT